MKRVRKYVVVLAMGGSTLLAGCNEFLTTIPESAYSAAGSYQTQADFNFSIAAVYAQQQELFRANQNWFRMMIARSDDTRNGATYTNGLDQFADQANNSEMVGTWRSFWVIISRSNIILDRIDAVEFTDSSMKNYIKGEAYALRAWAYYTLGWQYGGMPLIDKEMSVAEISTIPRSTQEETFAFAASDFQSAIGLLPNSWSGANAGRVTKYAAEAGLARLLMFQSKFSEAKPHLANVINSGLYEMEADYVNCFTDSHDNGKERVWEVQFSGNQSGEGQYLATGMIPEGYTDGVIMPFAGFSTAMFVSLDMEQAYEEGDLRKDVSIVKNLTVNGVAETRYAYILKYCHFDAYTPKTQQDWANNIPLIRYTDVKMMYAECLNEEGYQANGEAFTIINEVRARAGLAAQTPAQVPDQEAFRRAIRQERRVEFAFEGLRWNDLVRWGIAKDVINAHFAQEDEGEGRYSMADHQTIFPIPFDELSRYNDETIFWQNPGY